MTTPDSGQHARPCANCDQPLAGEYCSACGQHVVDLDRPLRSFLSELLRESLSLDSKLLRTLKALFFRPGFLTQEYLAGRRARYVPPIRLYLVMSFSLFLLLAWSSPNVHLTTSGDDTIIAPITLDAVSPDEGNGVAETDTSADEATFSSRLTDQMNRATEDPERFTEAFLDRMAQIVFLLLPAFALLLKLLYRQRPYVHHLLFSVYFHSFVFALLVVGSIIELAGSELVGSILLLAVPIYLLVGMKRVYERSWVATTFKWATLGAVHLGVVMLAVMVTLAISVIMF